MTPIPFGILSSAALEAIAYRFQTISYPDPASQFTSLQIAFAPNKSFAVSARTVVGGGEETNDFPVILKYDKTGTLEWQLTQSGSGDESVAGIAFDSANNLYAVGSTVYHNMPGGFMGLVLIKYDSSGTIQWQKTLGSEGTDRGNSIVIDSSDNIYVTGYGYVQGTSGGIITSKYDTSGNLQWSRRLAGTSNDNGRSIAIDLSGNVYVAGTTYNAGAGSQDLFLVKYNSSGTLQWQRTLGGAFFDNGSYVVVDSSGNPYISGTARSVNFNNDVVVAKYNSSGTLQWQRFLGDANTEDIYAITIDSSDNVYVTGTTSLNYDTLLVKYNSSGTIQWQRTIVINSSFDSGHGIAIDSSDNLWLVTTTSAPLPLLVAALPNDGSLTGTYTLNGSNIGYSASSFTAGTSSFVSASAALPESSYSASTGTSSISVTKTFPTEYKVYL